MRQPPEPAADFTETQVSSRLAYDGGLLKVLRDEVRLPDGQHAWRGRVGLVTQLVARGGFDASNTLALVCGPEVMMRHVADDLVGRGIAPGRVRLSLERNMRCGVGLCGHCQLRELFLCVDGPVLALDRVAPLMSVREL